MLSFIGSVCAPDKATLKTENHALECATAGPYNAIPSNLLEVALCVALVLTWWAATPSALRLAIELPHVRPRLDKASRKSKRPVAQLRSYFLSLLTGRKSSLHLPWLVAPRTLSILSFAWTVMANLMKLRRASKVLGPISRYRVADIVLHMQLVSRASRPGLTVGVLCILCMVYARLKDFTLKSMIIRGVLDARVNPTLSLITTSALSLSVPEAQ